MAALSSSEGATCAARVRSPFRCARRCMLRRAEPRRAVGQLAGLRRARAPATLSARGAWNIACHVRVACQACVSVACHVCVARHVRQLRMPRSGHASPRLHDVLELPQCLLLGLLLRATVISTAYLRPPLFGALRRMCAKRALLPACLVVGGAGRGAVTGLCGVRCTEGVEAYVARAGISGPLFIIAAALS